MLLAPLLSHRANKLSRILFLLAFRPRLFALFTIAFVSLLLAFAVRTARDASQSRQLIGVGFIALIAVCVYIAIAIDVTVTVTVTIVLIVGVGFASLLFFGLTTESVATKRHCFCCYRWHWIDIGLRILTRIAPSEKKQQFLFDFLASARRFAGTGCHSFSLAFSSV